MRRKKVEHLGFRQGVLLVVCSNHRTEVVIVRKASTKEWTLPAGGIEENESVLDTAKRELNEELGLTTAGILRMELSALTHRFEWNESLKKRTGFKGQFQNIVFVDIADAAAISIGKELAEMKFVPFGELAENISYPDLQETVRKLREEHWRG